MKPKFTVTLKKGRGKQPYNFSIKAANHEVIAPSEGYPSKTVAKRRALWWKNLFSKAYGEGACVFVDATKKV